MCVTCQYCNGRAAVLVGGDRIYPHRPDLYEKKFWYCEECGSYVGCHPAAQPGKSGGQGDGTVPLGELANAATRRARNLAHAAFDPFWKGIPGGRTKAYRWLAATLNIDKSRCHIGCMTVEQCAAVVRACMERRESEKRGSSAIA